MIDPVLALGLAGCAVVSALPWAAARPVGRVRVGGTRRRRGGRAGGAGRGGPPRLDVLVLLELLDAAIAAGVSLPRALGAVGEAAGGDEGRALVRASSALVQGADWREAWLGAPPRLGPVVGGLGPTWRTGAAPGPALRAAADQLRRRRRRREREAAGRLGVHLVLPLGLCFLPAFVLIGLVPVLISLGAGLLG